MDQSYLIIGGAPKSGTTSLFHYLSDHPEVCPANRKETYFFAREFDYNHVCKRDKSLAAFQSYFVHCGSSEKIRVEATPYTLYSKSSAFKIASLLPNQTVLFILRDPVDRLVSDYYFHIQRGHSSVQGTFQEFIDRQLTSRSHIPSLLDLGCYIEYLRPFYTAYGRSGIYVLFFEDFKTNPSAEMQKLCAELGIEPKFYRNYNFAVHNKTINVRYPWLNKANNNLESIAASVRQRVIRWPNIHKPFEAVLSYGKSIYRILNDRGPIDKEDISPDIREYLVNYYQPYNKALAKELGRPLPWQSFWAV